MHRHGSQQAVQRCYGNTNHRVPNLDPPKPCREARLCFPPVEIFISFYVRAVYIILPSITESCMYEHQEPQCWMFSYFYRYHLKVWWQTSARRTQTHYYISILTPNKLQVYNMNVFLPLPLVKSIIFQILYNVLLAFPLFVTEAEGYN